MQHGKIPNCYHLSATGTQLAASWSVKDFTIRQGGKARNRAGKADRLSNQLLK
jgi:hypothetical protein